MLKSVPVLKQLKKNMVLTLASHPITAWKPDLFANCITIIIFSLGTFCATSYGRCFTEENLAIIIFYLMLSSKAVVTSLVPSWIYWVMLRSLDIKMQLRNLSSIFARQIKAPNLVSVRFSINLTSTLYFQVHCYLFDQRLLWLNILLYIDVHVVFLRSVLLRELGWKVSCSAMDNLRIWSDDMHLSTSLISEYIDYKNLTIKLSHDKYANVPWLSLSDKLENSSGAANLSIESFN